MEYVFHNSGDRTILYLLSLLIIFARVSHLDFIVLTRYDFDGFCDNDVFRRTSVERTTFFVFRPIHDRLFLQASPVCLRKRRLLFGGRDIEALRFFSAITKGTLRRAFCDVLYNDVQDRVFL